MKNTFFCLILILLFLRCNNEPNCAVLIETSIESYIAEKDFWLTIIETRTKDDSLNMIIEDSLIGFDNGYYEIAYDLWACDNYSQIQGCLPLTISHIAAQGQGQMDMSLTKDLAIYIKKKYSTYPKLYEYHRFITDSLSAWEYIKINFTIISLADIFEDFRYSGSFFEIVEYLAIYGDRRDHFFTKTIRAIIMYLAYAQGENDEKAFIKLNYFLEVENRPLVSDSNLTVPFSLKPN